MSLQLTQLVEAAGTRSKGQARSTGCQSHVPGRKEEQLYLTGYTRQHAKAKAMRLIVIVVRVLANNNNLDLSVMAMEQTHI